MKIIGYGHKLGSKIVNNSDIAVKLGLNQDWFLNATGIKERRVCDKNEDVASLSIDSIKNACEVASFDLCANEDRTLLLHIQNGLTHLTPPPAIILAARLGCKNLRSLSIDGVCSEPINMIEIASLMLKKNNFDYVIVSAGVDFTSIINPKDRDTIGLFGAGAGSIIFARDQNNFLSSIKGLYWESKPEYWDLGIAEKLSEEKKPDHVAGFFSYYQMKGKGLAKIALQTIPRVIKKTIDEASWQLSDVDKFVTHQPNAKLLELGARQINLGQEKLFSPVANVGNLGPASLLSSFSMAAQNGQIKPTDKIILLSFGLGFSCGAIALEF